MIESKLILKTLSSLFAATLSASEYCFESDKADIASRTPWSHHSLSLYVDDARPTSLVRPVRSIVGVGVNDAITDVGGVDTVPLQGSATQDIDGRWLVSLTGTLIQRSLLNAPNHNGKYSYWLITINWILDPDAKNGRGHFGNLMTPFNSFPVQFNDSVETVITQVECDS